MKMIFNLIDKLIANPTKLNVTALDKLMTVGIPFNAPHGFKIRELGPEAVKISLPNRKLNHNHLSGIHACAIATAGEYAAGMSLLTSFGISKYRLIMSELNAVYTYQGRLDLEAVCSPKQIDISAVERTLETEGRYNQKLVTQITDKNGKEVATITTTWQLKPWEKVKTK